MFYRELMYQARPEGATQTIRLRGIEATARISHELNRGGSGTTEDHATLVEAREHFTRVSVEAAVTGAVITDRLYRAQTNDNQRLLDTIGGLNTRLEAQNARVRDLQTLHKDLQSRYDELDRTGQIVTTEMTRRQRVLETRMAQLVNNESDRLEAGRPLDVATAQAIQMLMYAMLIDMMTIMPDEYRFNFISKYATILSRAPFNVDVTEFLAKCAGLTYDPHAAILGSRRSRDGDPSRKGPPGGGATGGAVSRPARR
jgi:hypothetical protein